MKKCNLCKTEKSEEYFYKNKQCKDGLSSRCKECAIKRAKEWKAKNPDKVKKSAKKCREERHDEILQRQAKYREEHKESRIQSDAKYRDANRDLCRKRCLAYYYKNPEKHKKYRDDNREKFLEYSAKYRKNHSAEIRERKREYERKSRITKPLEHAARKAVYQALKNKSLVRAENCQMCNCKDNIEAHHRDYTKPLDVIWVCRRCHGGIHRTLNRIREEKEQQS